MLAAKCPPNLSFDEFLLKIRFPVLATPKIDGIRCIKIGGRALSRSLKPIPNKYIRESIERECPDGLDGELTCGDNFQAVTSGVMTHTRTPKFTYFVFGMKIHDLSFKYLDVINPPTLPSFCEFLLPSFCSNLDALFKYEEECLAQGAEGVMIRPPNGLYKYGRSTLNEQLLVAIKRFHDCEGIVVGFNERMSNGNEMERNALGYAERSSHLDGMIPMNTLGSLDVKLEDGKVVKVGTGFTDSARMLIWMTRAQCLGRTVTIKYQKFGVKDLPRLPVFKGFRKD